MSQASSTILPSRTLAGTIESADRAAASPQGVRGLSSFWLAVSRRRIRLSQLVFGGTFLVEVLFLRSRPRDVLAIEQWPTVLGGLAILLGLAIRSWAAGTLHKQRQLARTGPYALVRNPLYLGSFFLMVGLLILANSLFAIVALLTSIPILYFAAVWDEEQVLAGIYPEEWPLYCHQTPRFLPRSVRWPDARHWSSAQWLVNHEHHALLGTLAALAGLWFWRQLV